MLSGSDILAVPEGFTPDHGLKTLKGRGQKIRHRLFALFRKI